MRLGTLLLTSALAACAAGGAPVRQSDDECLHQLYGYPQRALPFQTAARACSGSRPIDLTGDPDYQVLASSLNVPFVTRKSGGEQATLTGTKLSQPTTEPAPPELHLY